MRGATAWCVRRGRRRWGGSGAAVGRGCGEGLVWVAWGGLVGRRWGGAGEGLVWPVVGGSLADQHCALPLPWLQLLIKSTSANSTATLFLRVPSSRAASGAVQRLRQNGLRALPLRVPLLPALPLLQHSRAVRGGGGRGWGRAGRGPRPEGSAQARATRMGYGVWGAVCVRRGQASRQKASQASRQQASQASRQKASQALRQTSQARRHAKLLARRTSPLGAWSGRPQAKAEEAGAAGRVHARCGGAVG